MEYNKFTHNSNSRKRWLVISVSLLAALSGGLLMAHNGSNVHASATDLNQNPISQQSQTNHTYQPQLYNNQPEVNNNQGVQVNSQQDVKPQINNLCGQILRNHVQSSQNTDNGVRRTLGDFSFPSEINSQANYRNIEDGTIVEYGSMDGAEGSKIDYSQYTNPSAVPAGFTFVKLGKHSNVYLPQNEPGGINTIWIAPISKTNSQPSSASSSMTSASSSVASSSISASSSESLSSEAIPPKPISNSVSNESVNSGNQSSVVSSTSASTSVSVSSSVNSSSDAISSNSSALSSASSSVSSASASKSKNVSSSASESQQASSTSASNHVTSQSSANNGSVNSNSMTSETSSSNNVSESTAPVSSSDSSSNVTSASETSEASSNLVSSTTSIQSSSASAIPSYVPSFVSSSASSSSVNVNSNLNSWYTSLMNSIADNHQSTSASSAPVSSVNNNISSSSASLIVNSDSLNSDDQQSQVTSTAPVRHTKPVARHVRAVRKSANRMKTWRYHGHIYRTYRRYITPGDFRKGHHMYIRLIKDCNEYRSTRYTRRNCVRHLRKGMRLSIKRVVMITPHITRFQLTNGDYVTSNQHFARVIK